MRNSVSEAKKKTSKTPVKRAPQERGRKTRELLIQAAIASLVETGVHGLRFSQIAKLAGVPQPLIDYHFPSMEGMLMEMIQHMVEKLKLRSIEAIQANSSKPRKAFEGYIRAPFILGAEERGFLAVFSAYYHLATIDKKFADINRGVRGLGHERHSACIVAILNAEKKSHLTSKHKLISDVATQIQGLTTGYVIVASSESEGNFKTLADLAVKASFQILDTNFPD